MHRIVIVGGGISGLALAYRLEQALPDADVTVLERGDRPGGTIWTERHDGFLVETGPNGFLDTKPATLSLCRDIGLGPRLTAASDAASRNRYLFLDGRPRLLPSNLFSFVRNDVLSWRGKLALLAERFRSPRCDGTEESIDAFARRRAGDEVADVLVDAFVTGIYAGEPKRLSLQAAFPRLAAMEQQHGSILKGMAAAAKERRRDAAARGEVYQSPGRMWSFHEGMGLLIKSLCDRLRHPPLLGISVRRIERGPSGWMVHGEGQDRWPADIVVLTCPARAQAAILAVLDAELADRIATIPYSGVVVVALGYRRTDVPHPLDGFGYLTPERCRRDVLGVQWCSSIFPGRAPPGMVLLRAMCGGWRRPEIVGWDDARLLQAIATELRQALGISAAPVFERVIRWDRAIPQYEIGHLQRVAWIEERAARYPGLFLAGNAYHGVALNDCTEQAELLVPRLAAALGAACSPGSPEARC
jgi:oxygen-dependent protoporphyrinogen oxidase